MWQGEMVNELWYDISNDFDHVRLHDFVVMPNHIHGIIEIVGAPLVGAHVMKNMVDIHEKNVSMLCKERAPTRGAPTVGEIIGAFKSKTTNEYIQMVKNNILPPFQKRIWQRNFYEHVIRDENDHARISQYIVNNPLTWKDDMLNTP